MSRKTEGKIKTLFVCFMFVHRNAAAGAFFTVLFVFSILTFPFIIMSL